MTLIRKNSWFRQLYNSIDRNEADQDTCILYIKVMTYSIQYI